MHTDPKERLTKEFQAVDLGDRRLNRRAIDVASRLRENPGATFPDAIASEASIEGFYRLVNNKRVGLQALLKPHIGATHRVMADLGTVLVVHDTTDCSFVGEGVRKGVGFVGRHPGFRLHAALAVSADATRAPLGVVGMMPIVRPTSQAGNRKTHWRKRYNRYSKESNRWGALIDRVEKQSPGGSSMIHVMDREADAFRLLAALQKEGRRFVVRLSHNRKVLEDGMNVSHLQTVLSRMAFVEDVAERDVNLSGRNTEKSRPRMNDAHPKRDQREAKLGVRAARFRVARPERELDLPASLELSVVQVHELNPPPGEEPVEWTLISSEPVSTARKALQVVDYYLGRWRIEEYFKALKTGCSFEKRQLESLDALLNALGLLAPIAWQLLALRALAHHSPDGPCIAVLRPSQVAVLHSMRGLKQDATLHEALGAIAALGGHLKRNGPPGWLTLGRGMKKLIMYECAWLAAKAEM